MESPESNKIVNFAAFKAARDAEKQTPVNESLTKEEVQLVKEEIGGLAFDFLHMFANTELIWEDPLHEHPDVIACELREEDNMPTNRAVVIDFANYINAHKPAGLIGYSLDNKGLTETPPRIVFTRQTDN